MPEATRASAVRWPVPIALAVPALAAAIAVTFSGGHTATFGFFVFAGFAILTAVAAFLGTAFLGSPAQRLGSVLKGVAGVLGGAAALVLPWFLGGDAIAEAAALAFTLAGTLAVVGTVDLVLGVRQRRADRFGRDWIATGVIELLGAVAIIAVPPAFYQAFSFKEKTGELVSGALTSSTMIVGIFGAIAAIIGVFLAIAGVGLVPQRRRATA